MFLTFALGMDVSVALDEELWFIIIDIHWKIVVAIHSDVSSVGG